MKNRKIKKSIFDTWAVSRKRPVMELAIAADISIGMASGILSGTYRGGHAPTSAHKRRAIVRVVGTTEDEAFPLAA